eukprot:TRINITY_DN2645_c1_g1_i1.p1 TRINITY_DN2645_c1_g1~~TRINITY_DN2645_c1_g1_i1.p1  ORF type:complete len:115 (-),score=19.99 TRINITY_DN2645_c1_g1_i1:56-400(-)
MKIIKKFGRRKKPRKMLFRNQTTQLLRNEEMKTTLQKAKEVRRFADKMVVLAKKGDLHSRRQANAFLTDKELVKKMFFTYPGRFQDRTSGFTRINHYGTRKGDNAKMAIIQLLD